MDSTLGDPQPWTDSMRSQHGEDVLCLPYQEAPLYTKKDFDDSSFSKLTLKADDLDVNFVSIVIKVVYISSLS